MFSVIVTVDLSRRPVDIFNKLRKLINNRFEFVIGFANRGRVIDDLFISYFSNKIKIANCKFSSHEPVNNSKLRNAAANLATFDVLLLLDVDIYFDEDLFVNQAKSICDENPFSMLPCVYLSRFGTKKIHGAYQFIKERCIQADRRYYQHLALPSSVIFLLKKDYVGIGGFDEDYCGHGYEDFDFMTRLFLMHGKLKDIKDFFIDESYRSAFKARGFRRVLAQVAINNLEQSIVAFHMHHKTGGKSESYYKYREMNSVLFLSKFSNILSATNDNEYYIDTSNIEHPIFFDNRASVDGRFDTLKQKIKFVIGK